MGAILVSDGGDLLDDVRVDGGEGYINLVAVFITRPHAVAEHFKFGSVLGRDGYYHIVPDLNGEVEKTVDMRVDSCHNCGHGE